MEPNKNQASWREQLNKVTPLSRTLAAILFVVLPFIGGWIGYRYAPAKVVIVETAIPTISRAVPEPSLSPSVVSQVSNEQSIGSSAGIDFGGVIASFDNATLYLKSDFRDLSMNYPITWQPNFKNNTTLTSQFIGIMNPATPGKPDTDVPREAIWLRLSPEHCTGSSTVRSNRIVLYDTGWTPDGFVGGAFERSVCVAGSSQSVSISFKPLDTKTQDEMDALIESIVVK